MICVHPIHSVSPNLILLHQQHVFLDPDFPTGLSGLEFLRETLDSRSPEKEVTEYLSVICAPCHTFNACSEDPHIFPDHIYASDLALEILPLVFHLSHQFSSRKTFAFLTLFLNADNIWGHLSLLPLLYTSFLCLSLVRSSLINHAGLLAPFAWFSACQEGLCLTLEEVILENLPYPFSLGPQSKQAPKEVQICSPDVQAWVSICLVPSSHDPDFTISPYLCSP